MIKNGKDISHDWFVKSCEDKQFHYLFRGEYLDKDYILYSDANNTICKGDVDLRVFDEPRYKTIIRYLIVKIKKVVKT